MRQAGILAAAGIGSFGNYGNPPGRGSYQGKKSGRRIIQIPEISLWENSPQTNMVFLDVSLKNGKTIQDFEALLRDHKILVSHVTQKGLRLVTHVGISDSDIEETINAFKSSLSVDLNQDIIPIIIIMGEVFKQKSLI